jgi:hypothetical protein
MEHIFLTISAVRCTVPTTQLAALRLTTYWKKRLQMFGPDRAFLPLTQDEALKNDAVALGMGYFQLNLPKDPSGHGIIFVDPSRQDKSKYERESMVRSMWYVMHAALEDEETQKKGLVVIAYPKKVKLSQVDRALTKMNMDSLKGCLPIRIGVFHVCHPPGFFQLVFLVFKMFLGERLRKRFRVHGGSDNHVLETLASPRTTCLPRSAATLF